MRLEAQLKLRGFLRTHPAFGFLLYSRQIPKPCQNQSHHPTKPKVLLIRVRHIGSSRLGNREERTCDDRWSERRLLPDIMYTESVHCHLHHCANLIHLIQYRHVNAKLARTIHEGTRCKPEVAAAKTNCQEQRIFSTDVSFFMEKQSESISP